jgi:hypothetical protein
VAVLNTWFDKSTTAANGSGATAQAKLCKPSGGGEPNDDNMFAEYCGDERPTRTSFCPGDMIQVQYAIANYSTEDVDVTTNLWFSKDQDWDPGDSVSPTSWYYNVGATYSQHKAESYEVPTLPALPGLNMWAIIRVTATTPSGVTVKDSIPLRGAVQADSSCFKLSGTLAP